MVPGIPYEFTNVSSRSRNIQPASHAAESFHLLPLYSSLIPPLSLGLAGCYMFNWLFPGRSSPSQAKSKNTDESFRHTGDKSIKGTQGIEEKRDGRDSLEHRRATLGNKSVGGRNMSPSSDPPLSILDTCLDALFYQDGELKFLTHNTPNLIEDAKSQVGEANALFLAGSCSRAGRLKYFVAAEEKGCDHPILYYSMAECYRRGDKDIGMDKTKAIEYYNKAIAGT